MQLLSPVALGMPSIEGHVHCVHNAIAYADFSIHFAVCQDRIQFIEKIVVNDAF